MNKQQTKWLEEAERVSMELWGLTTRGMGLDENKIPEDETPRKWAERVGKKYGLLQLPTGDDE